MANMHLVTGYAGQEHVTAADHGAFNAALIGTGQFVLDKGNVFEAQVISNNTVRVLDGELMMQGRFVRLDPGTYVDLTIENGAQGMKRNDLIVARYTKNTSTAVETVDLVVIKGTAVADSPADPSYTEADITNGQAVQNDFPLWRIPLDGLNVGEPVSLFGEPFMDSMRTLPEIRRQVNQIHSEVDKKIEGIDSYLKPEVLTDGTKAMYGFGTNAVPDEVFAHLGQYAQHWWSILHGASQTIYIEHKKDYSNYTELHANNSGEDTTLTYADSVSVDPSTGTVTMNNPKQYTATKRTEGIARTIAGLIRGKYVTGLAFHPAGVYYIPSSATLNWYDPGYQLLIWNFQDLTHIQQVTSVQTVIPEGETTYARSTNRNAYPDRGTVGGRTYTYLGVPFDNSIVPVKTATGSYAGTDTYGESNPNSLTFDFEPKVVVITSIVPDSESVQMGILTAHGGMVWNGEYDRNTSGGTYSQPALNSAINGNTVTWYSNNANQLNSLGKIYHYFAIG